MNVTHFRNYTDKQSMTTTLDAIVRTIRGEGDDGWLRACKDTQCERLSCGATHSGGNTAFPTENGYGCRRRYYRPRHIAAE